MHTSTISANESQSRERFHGYLVDNRAKSSRFYQIDSSRFGRKPYIVQVNICRRSSNHLYTTVFLPVGSYYIPYISAVSSTSKPSKLASATDKSGFQPSLSDSPLSFSPWRLLQREDRTAVSLRMPKRSKFFTV